MRGIASSLLTVLLFGFLGTSGCEPPGAVADSSSSIQEVALTPKEELGKLLFFDTTLSSPPGQACSNCHAPDAGFGDRNRELPVSRGAHPDRYGNRNDLTAAYAAHIPPLAFDEAEGHWVGGLFWDGRASSLAEQAEGPPLNPLEMANPDVAAILEALDAAPYRQEFLTVFGEQALEDPDQAYDYMADAIAAYEATTELNRFDSKYDLYLSGKVELTDEELRGLALFENEQKGNCSACHFSRPGPDGSPPLFSDYTYDNLGTPKNPANPFYSLPPDLNPDGVGFVDLGLGPVVGDPELNGFFRVPTLRNVAITPPYMHNGVFWSLYEVVSFYNSRDVAPWPEPEVATNVNRDELGNLGLTPEEMESIVAFLRTLTDGYDPSR